MLIIGCDFHPGFQQVAIFDNRTGEVEEKRLQHRAEAEEFYRTLAGQEVRVGMEACGHYPWFERLLEKWGIELWLGDAAKIRASVVRKQKTDRRDAEHLLQLLMEEQDQPTGQFVSALFAGGSGTDGGADRSATAALLQTPGDAQESQRRQSGGGQEVGHAVVPDVARRLDVRATMSGRHAGKPESFCGRPVRAEGLSGPPASLEEVWEIEVSNRGCKSRRDGWWDLVSRCEI